MFPKQQEKIRLVIGSVHDQNLNKARMKLAIIQAAFLLSLQGITRATATRITELAISQFNVSITPEDTGKTLKAVDIRKTMIHGKSHYILETTLLKKAAKAMEDQCLNIMAQLADDITQFKDLHSQIKELQDQWQRILQSDRKKRELTLKINENILKLKEINNLEKQCHQLSQQVLTLPSLEKRRNALEDALTKHKADEQSLATREARLGKALEEFKLRYAWATLLDLNYSIHQKEKELTELYQQPAIKPSLWERFKNRWKKP